MAPKYKRVLLKLSGESLAGKAGHGIDFDTVLEICKPVKEVVDMGVEVAKMLEQSCHVNLAICLYRIDAPPSE